MTSNSGLWTELQEQGRATVAAFTVVGVTFLYTMEAWWLAWKLDMVHLLVYTVVGLGIVLLLTRIIGFREQGEGGNQGSGGNKSGGGRSDGPQGDGTSQDSLASRLYEPVTDATEALVQGFVAAYLILFLFGVLTLEDSLTTAARLGVFQVVPLGFGAALANKLFAGSESEQPSKEFPKTIGVFAIGAIFLSAPIGLTQEVELIAVYASYARLAALLVATLLVAYLTLFELEMGGQAQRVQGRSKLLQVGQTFTVYLIGVTVAAGLLAAFGQFDGQPLSVWVQKTVVLAFPASVGASAAQVIL